MTRKDIADCSFVIKCVIGHLFPEANNISVDIPCNLPDYLPEVLFPPIVLGDKGKVNMMLIQWKPLGPFIMKHLKNIPVIWFETFHASGQQGTFKQFYSY